MLETTTLRQHLDELSEKKWTLLSINPQLSSSLLQKAQDRLIQKQFRQAELAAAQNVVSAVRNDKIFWLDAKIANLDNSEKEILSTLDHLLHEIKNDLRVSLKEVECHYAFYDKGHFYKKHRDTTAFQNKRVFSFVLYLNSDWNPEDGGYLVGYEEKEILFQIKPEMGNMILFHSDLEHEVKPTSRGRFSLTGWFRK